jgi:hypothetical protein
VAVAVQAVDNCRCLRNGQNLVNVVNGKSSVRLNGE